MDSNCKRKPWWASCHWLAAAWTMHSFHLKSFKKNSTKDIIMRYRSIYTSLSLITEGEGLRRGETTNQQNRTFDGWLISKSEGRLNWYWHFAWSYPWPVPFYLDLDRELELEERDDERERDDPERLPFFLAGLSSSSLAFRSYFDRSPSSSSSSSSLREGVFSFYFIYFLIQLLWIKMIYN